MTAKVNDAGGKYREDPINSHKPRGKARSRRKGSRDPGFTPTELHRKNQLMRQFMKNPEGGGIGNSEAYRASPAWCSGCHGRRLAEIDGLCVDCHQRRCAPCAAHQVAVS